jgi:hypothetical protein
MPVVLGLDISKSTAAYWLLNQIPQDPKRYARTQRIQKIEATPAGRDQLLALEFDFAVMEPTGVYSRIWRHWLRQANRPYRLVGHAELAHYRDAWKLQKTDKLDSLAMALYGLERGDRPSAFLVERDYQLSDLIAYLDHLNRQKNGYQNNLRQKLIWQLPEWQDRHIFRPWKGNVPGILTAIAGEPSQKWQREIDSSCGLGLRLETRSLARILIAIEEEEISAERWIDEELNKPQYVPYLAAAEKCGFSHWLTACFIGAIYPFEQFLYAGRPRIARSLSKVKGLPVKKDESLRAFKLACGMGQIFVQSGDFEGWVAGGSGDMRMTLRNSIYASYLSYKKNLKQEVAIEDDRHLNLIKHQFDNQGMMRVARRWTEQYYRALLRQQPWGGVHEPDKPELCLLP